MKKLIERFNQYLHGNENAKKSETKSSRKSSRKAKRIKRQSDESSWSTDLPESSYHSGFYSDFDDRTYRNELDQSPLKSFTEPKSFEGKL